MASILCVPSVRQVQAQDAPDDGQSKAEQERRKKLARLGTGRVRLAKPVGEVYSLQGLVERGMSVNPELVARRYAEVFAELRTQEADWARFPKFDITSSLTAVPAEADFDEVGKNLESFAALDIGPLSVNSVKLVVPIYSFGKISMASELADLGVDQAQLETRKKRLRILTQLREAYYSVQLGKQIKATMADGVDIIREEIERQDEAREFGDDEVDVVQLRKLQMYEADILTKLVDNDRLIRLTKAALGVLVDLDVNTFDVPPFEEDLDLSVLPTLAQSQSLARENRVDLQLLEAALRARKLQADLAFTAFLPDIFFALDFSVGLSTEEAPNQNGFVVQGDGAPNLPLEVEPLSDPYNFTRLGFVVGARLRVDPVNQSFKYREARAKLAETRALRRAAIAGVNLDIERAWVEANDNKRKVEILGRRFKAADRWRKQMAVAFESGGAEFKDFLQPIKAYYEAKLLLLGAKYNFRVSMAKLGEKVGVTNLGSIAGELDKP
jgi:outer membrane protein TolC